MKKVVFLVSVLVLAQLLPLDSFAKQQYYTIQEVREQVPRRWTQTYETKWRTIDIDVCPTVPDVDTMPVLQVKAAYWQPEENGLDERWISLLFGMFEYTIGDYCAVAKATNGKLNETFFTPPYDYERAYLYESSFTLYNALDYVRQLMEEAQLSYVDYHMAYCFLVTQIRSITAC